MTALAAGQPALQPTEGASHAAILSAGAGVTTFLAPGANVNGAIVRTAYVLGSGYGQIYADTVAPATNQDTTKRSLFGAQGNTQWALAGPIRLAPGVGIFFAVNGINGFADVTWDLL